jgi:hypothetical protein
MAMNSRAAASQAHDLRVVFKGEILSMEATALFPYTRTAQVPSNYTCHFAQMMGLLRA